MFGGNDIIEKSHIPAARKNRLIGAWMSGAKAFVCQVGQRGLAKLTQISCFRFYALLLFLAMAAAYNAQIWRMGYYYDDWEGVFLQKQLFSFRQIWEYFLVDRPFSVLVHWSFDPLLGAAPIGWRILGQLLNWAAVLLLVKTLLNIWPRRVMEIGWIGLLLALYPGIARQFVIRTSIPHYTSMLLFTLSLWMMVKAVMDPRRRILLLILSVLLGLLQMLIIEYFVGLELIRLLLLFYIARKSSLSNARAVRKAFLGWLPYAVGFTIFLVFRLGILPMIQMQGMVVKNQPRIIAQLLANPVSTVMSYAEIITQDLIYAVVYVWSQLVVPEEFDFQARATLLSWLVGMGVAALCAVGVELWHRKAVPEEEREPYPFFIFVICAAALLLGGLPIWAVGRQAIQGMWASRYLFGPVLGAVPLVIVLVVSLTGQPRRRAQSVFLAVLLAGSLSLQFRTANKYALNWDYQRDYYWQLKWRAPALKPGAFILSPYTPFSYNADYEIAFAINILYAPGNPQSTARYWWFDGPDDIRDFTTQRYPQELQIDHTFRSLTFQSDMQHALPVLYRPARGCLQVVSQAYQNQPGLLPEERQLYTVSNIGLISVGGPDVPHDVFGEEPKHGWCFYFQKADLAMEKKQWDQVAGLWDEATARGLKPAFSPEYLPFIEGSLHTARWQQAIRITQAANGAKDMAPFLCASWSRVVKELPDSVEKRASWDLIKTQLACGNPEK